MDIGLLKQIFQAMLTARQIDRVSQAITNRGEAHFSLSGAGHEGTAVLASCLTPDDWLHCHYRSRALLAMRGVKPRTFFDNLLGNEQSCSRGRRMCTFFSDVELNILSMVTPVGNNALQAVGVATAIKNRPQAPIVLCGMGDGTTQQGEVMEACAQASRDGLPVLFYVEDNQWAISTSTISKTFYATPERAESFHGVPIHYLDGCDVVESFSQLQSIVPFVRNGRRPAIVVFQVERLESHTTADDQRVYRLEEDLRRARSERDPLVVTERSLVTRGVTLKEIDEIRQEVTAKVTAAEKQAFATGRPTVESSAKRPLAVELTHPSHEYRGKGEPQLTMREALNHVLRSHLANDQRVCLYGEDIEDPKGDVFGVTRGLSTEFPGRVNNAALTESTIVGLSIGRALAGQKPVAFVQFADFLPLALNQLMSELATLHWRADGQWNTGVVIMAPCGAYRPGLGPYHAQTMEAIVAHTPGIDVMMPATATDAAGMLNAAMSSNRPTLFLYPKSRLNDQRVSTPMDVDRQLVPIGTARKIRAGRDLTLVAWGNTVQICQQTADELNQVDVETEIIDLRYMSPWDQRAILASAEKTARLIVVHEDNQTGGFGGEIVATVAEHARVPVAVRRVARPDVHVPCNFANQMELLPTLHSVLEVAAELLDLRVTWQRDEPRDDGVFLVEAIGSGPADESVLVVELNVQPGDVVKRGDMLGSLEATKSVFELTSPIEGEVREILVDAGRTVEVGTPIVRLRTGREIGLLESEHICPGTPTITRKPSNGVLRLRWQAGEPRRFDVGISSVATVEGSRLVHNDDLISSGAGRTSGEIFRMTGIENRYWANQDENAVTMAVKACEDVLDRESLLLDDIDMLVCSTTSPISVTPSTACRVLNGLITGKPDTYIQAHDISAACSGYLYALQTGYDYLQSTPNGRVLVVTTEVLSPLLDPEDFDTAILFGDAASATVLYGENHFDRATGRLFRPELSAKGDVAHALSVPLLHDGFIQMQGKKVFSEAVRSMITSLNRACQQHGIGVNDLKMIVPHQANQRIIDAIQNRIGLHVYSNIRHHGNTSSSSIPLCLTEILPASQKGDRLGLCAFGGGFTFGASVVQLN